MRIFPKSTIGKKVVMSLTGLGLIFFLFFHLAGNLLLYQGEETFNLYAYNLHKFSFLLHSAETFLFFIFVYHIASAVSLAKISRLAKGGQSYAKQVRLGKGTVSSHYMVYSGSLILIFLVLHLVTFKIWDKSLVSYPNYEPMENLYANVLHWFSMPWYSIIYIISSIGLGLHLKHAFSSAFKTLGIDHHKYSSWLKTISTFVCLILAFGFASFPIFFGFIM